MTETGAGAWITANREPRHVGQRCFGKAPPGLAYRIVDDAQNDTERGVAGELLVRREAEAPRRGFFSGYYKDEAATRQALGRRLVPYRRPGAAGRRRRLFLRRPFEEHDPTQRREHRGRGGRKRAPGASRRTRLRRLPGAGRAPRRGGVRVRGAASGPLGLAGKRNPSAGSLSSGARLLQVARDSSVFARPCRRPHRRSWRGRRSRNWVRAPWRAARPSICVSSSGARPGEPNPEHWHAPIV